MREACSGAAWARWSVGLNKDQSVESRARGCEQCVSRGLAPLHERRLRSISIHFVRWHHGTIFPQLNVTAGFKTASSMNSVHAAISSCYGPRCTCPHFHYPGYWRSWKNWASGRCSPDLDLNNSQRPQAGHYCRADGRPRFARISCGPASTDPARTANPDTKTTLSATGISVLL